jgi:signal transduction histidine kinase/ActR/RegA family two-component response regulator
VNGPTLRSRLLLLVAAGVLPITVASGFALLAVAEYQKERAKQSGIEITRALSTAVDAELQRSSSVLEGLATSTLLDSGDLKGYHEALRRVVATRPEWLSAVLHDRHGVMLLNTRLEFGAKTPPTAEKESLDLAMQTHRPVIGYLARGALGTYNLALRVPVLRDGELRYVLSAVINPDAIVQIITRQRLAADWVVSVFDGKGMRVARSRQHADFLGKAPAPSLKRLMDESGNEGSGTTYALEGDLVYTAYSRSPSTGWAVAIGIPPAVVESGAARSLAAYGGGIALSIAIGFLAAFFIARRITVPMAALSVAAQALGRRQAVSAPATRIGEIRSVADSLVAAAHEREKAEAEREELLRREQEARAAAEAASRAKDEFLAMLGHELRNPLGAIANASHLLERAALDAGSEQHAKEVIRRQVEHLSRLTDDLLDAGRAVMGKIVLQREPLDLAAVVSRALDTLQATERLGAHRLQRNLAPVWVNADYTRLEQILVNLIGNAIKFTPSGGTITVGVHAQGDDAVLSVRDTGVGMTPELCARAFDLFVQGDGGIDRTQGGLGIGLTLVRRLAELHGGHAGVTSEGRGQGSEATVRLPAIQAPAAVPPVTTQRYRGRRCDILIVDDNRDGAETLRRLLELAGHTVRIEYDGLKGLEAALKQPPDVGLIDIGLPGIDGYELVKRIRSSLGEHAPFLVAVTGYGVSEDRSRALAAGFDAHLVKPVDMALLESLLATAQSDRSAVSAVARVRSA